MKYSLDNVGTRLLVLAIGSLIITLPIGIYYQHGTSGIEVFSVIMTSILTFGLVILYFQQSAILKKQSELMHRDYQSALGKRGTIVANGDEVIIKVKNSGRGKIRRMYLKSEIISDTGDIEVGFRRTTMTNIENDSLEVPANSGYEKYKGKVSFRILSSDAFDDGRRIPFKLMSKTLSHNGVTTCKLKLTLEIVDEGIIDEQFSYVIDLAEQELELEEPQPVEYDGIDGKQPPATTLEDAIKYDYSGEQEINRVTPEDLEDRFVT